MWRSYVVVALLLLSLAPAAARAEAHAVVLLYHHVSADTPASTSVTPERFERHLDFLEDEGYRVWSLERVLAAVYGDAEALPADVVAITFDDAYESVLSEAHPRLNARGWPYTVFVNTDAVDAGHSPYLGWGELRQLAEDGVTIGNHSAAHGHMAAPGHDETRSDWHGRIQADIDRAHARIADEIGRPPELFAYPYGEDSPALAEAVADRYRFALVQRSGALGPDTDPLAIPRFPMATGFSSLERLELAVGARPLAVSGTETGADGSRGDLDWVRLQLGEGGYRPKQLSCFSGGGDRLPIEVEEGDSAAIRIDVDGVGSAGRNKVNCTAPAVDGSGDFYWYSFQWLVEP